MFLGENVIYGGQFDESFMLSICPLFCFVMIQLPIISAFFYNGRHFLVSPDAQEVMWVTEWVFPG